MPPTVAPSSETRRKPAAFVLLVVIAVRLTLFSDKTKSDAGLAV